MSFIGGLIVGGFLVGFAILAYIEGGFWYR